VHSELGSALGTQQIFDVGAWGVRLLPIEGHQQRPRHLDCVVDSAGRPLLDGHHALGDDGRVSRNVRPAQVTTSCGDELPPLHTEQLQGNLLTFDGQGRIEARDGVDCLRDVPDDGFEGGNRVRKAVDVSYVLPRANAAAWNRTPEVRSCQNRSVAGSASAVLVSIPSPMRYVSRPHCA
jgi:hypothetical protein